VLARICAGCDTTPLLRAGTNTTTLAGRFLVGWLPGTIGIDVARSPIRARRVFEVDCRPAGDPAEQTLLPAGPAFSAAIRGNTGNADARPRDRAAPRPE
jgi:hypothetical protein